jgi:4-hydroxy-tetrahydrodipicolinate synthase
MSEHQPNPSAGAPPRLRGIFAPTLTPVRADLSPDVPRWIDHSRRLLADGCHGLCPFGTTSEANSFGLYERMEMLERLIDAGIPAAQLMPGAGACAIPDTVQMTAHAVRHGCGGVLLLPPFYYKGVSDDGLFRAIAEVVERVGDSRLRIYLYHIPPQAQIGFSISLIERLIKAYPDTVVGIKDSSGDWNNLNAILTNFPGFGTFTGAERFLLQTIHAGGAGSINAVANVIAPVQRRLFDRADTPEAAALQDEVNKLRAVYGELNLPAIPALKQIVAHLRHDPEWVYVRPPFTTLTDAQAGALLAKFETSGVMAATSA